MHKNQRYIIIISILFILLAGSIYYFNNIRIPKLAILIENDVRKKVDVVAMPKRKVAVIKDMEGIPKYTQLTTDIIEQKIHLVDIPVDFVVEGAAVDIDLIAGRITKEDLRFGEQVVMDSLSKEEKWFEDFDRLKEFTIHSIVAEEVKQGNIVDVNVNYGNGKYDIVVPKIKVRKLIKNETKEGDVKYTLVFAVNEEMYRDLSLASTKGNLETRLYIDESQSPSQKTFKYNAQAQNTVSVQSVTNTQPNVKTSVQPIINVTP